MGILDVPGISRQAAAPNLLPAAITSGASPRRFDPRTSVYGATAANTRKTKYALARAKAGVGTSHFVCVGDSTTAGQFLTVPADAYPTLLGSLLTSRGYPVTGTGVVFPNNLAGSLNTVPLRDGRWTYAVGTWTLAANGNSVYYIGAASAGATATFVSDIAGTVVDLYYLDRATFGGFTYSIDGGAAVTVNMTGSTGGTVQKVSVTGLANTTHTVVFTTSTSSGTYIVGACVRAATGLMVTNAGMGSVRVNPFADPSPILAGGTIVALTPAPDAVFIMLQTNDARDGLAIATYKSQLTTVVSRYQAIGADVWLMTGVTPYTAAYGGVAMPTAQWTTYRQALYDLSDTLDIALIDVSENFGLFTTSNPAGLMYDALHPNRSGNALTAMSMVSAALG